MVNKNLDVDKSPKIKWMESLEKKTKKIKKKDLPILAKQYIKLEKQDCNKYTCNAINYKGNEIIVINNSAYECYKDILTLNGFTIED